MCSGAGRDLNDLFRADSNMRRSEEDPLPAAIFDGVTVRRCLNDGGRYISRFNGIKRRK